MNPCGEVDSTMASVANPFTIRMRKCQIIKDDIHTVGLLIQDRMLSISGNFSVFTGAYKFYLCDVGQTGFYNLNPAVRLNMHAAMDGIGNHTVFRFSRCNSSFKRSILRLAIVDRNIVSQRNSIFAHAFLRVNLFIRGCFLFFGDCFLSRGDVLFVRYLGRLVFRCARRLSLAGTALRRTICGAFPDVTGILVDLACERRCRQQTEDHTQSQQHRKNTPRTHVSHLYFPSLSKYGPKVFFAACFPSTVEPFTAGKPSSHILTRL